jgi:predicted RNase H-like nuclease
VAGGKLVGVSLYPELPEVIPTLREVLDHIPAYVIVALAAPVGLIDEFVPGGRACDRAARQLLGWPRLGAIASAPTRKLVENPNRVAPSDHLGVVSKQMLRKLAEVDAEIQPYRQRTVYSVHPELSFHQINGDKSLRRSKHRKAGVEERRRLLIDRMQGAERALAVEIPRVSTAHLLDAVASLWTARRIAARAVARIPDAPEWDAMGLRMEYVR